MKIMFLPRISKHYKETCEQINAREICLVIINLVRPQNFPKQQLFLLTNIFTCQGVKNATFLEHFSFYPGSKWTNH